MQNVWIILQLGHKHSALVAPMDCFPLPAAGLTSGSRAKNVQWGAYTKPESTVKKPSPAPVSDARCLEISDRGAVSILSFLLRFASFLASSSRDLLGYLTQK